MFSSAISALFTASLIGSAFAHMQMVNPPPLRGKTNPNAASGSVDFDMSSPLDPTGVNFPCKGYLGDLGKADAASVAQWAAGSQQSFQLDSGGAPHGGGSMQASLSFDQGKTFRVIKSFIGNAPRNTGGNSEDPDQSYTFTVPQDAKSGDAIFSWTWFNEIGNREMYQNCAVVTITGSGNSDLSDRPEIFKANIGNQCATTEGTDVEFPNPGPDVERHDAVSGAKPAPPTGTCDVSTGPAPPADPAPSDEPTATVPSATSTAAPAPSPSPMPGCNQHVVVKGETCNIIGAQYGVPGTQIMSLNPEINSGCTNLKPGQVVQVRKRSRIMRN
jgi:LysM repeat protein